MTWRLCLSRARSKKRDDRGQIRLLTLAEARARVRFPFGAPPFKPCSGVVRRAISPEEAFGLAARIPLLGRHAQAGQKLRVLLALVEPLPELRPPLDQRLVDDLHGPTLPLAAGLDEQEPRFGQTMRDLFGRVAVLRELTQLQEGSDRPRTLGRDEPEQDRPREPLFPGGERREHGVGVRRQRPCNAAERAIAVHGEQLAVTIARFPQLGGREMEER